MVSIRDGPIGEVYPLLIFGLEPTIQKYLERQIQTYQLGNSVRLLPTQTPSLVPTLFQNASAFFHPAQSAAWAGFIRLALRCGKPLVAAASPLVEALVGPAAYLAPAEELRLLGAGLITVIIEESVAQKLSEQGNERAAGWESSSFQDDLYAAYQAVLQ